MDVEDEEDLLYLHVLFAMQDCRLTTMSAHMANIFFYMFKKIEFDRPRLLKDLTNGTVNPSLDLRADVRRCLETRIRSDCNRAKDLQKAFDCGLEGLALRLWPSLQVAVCIDSGANNIYEEMLRDTYFKGVTMYSPFYAAAEGLLGINIWPRNLPTRYMLNPRANFYELIPVENVLEEQPDTVLIKEVSLVVCILYWFLFLWHCWVSYE
jgi:hypothetical protein